MSKIFHSEALSGPRGARFLHFRASHDLDRTLVMSLHLHGRNRVPTRLLVFLFPGMEADIDLDLHTVEQGRPIHARIPGVGPVYNGGPVIRVADLRRVSFVVHDPPRGMKLKVSHVKLTQQKGPLCLTAAGPRVDAFGQPTWLDWPGKAEEGGLFPSVRVSRPKVWAPAISKNARWSVVVEDGRHWLRAPDGSKVFSTGVNCVGAAEPCQV